MSSVVNKSQKRFMPKVSSRGPGGRAPARRLSTLRTSFSVPAHTDSMSSRRQSVVDKENATPAAIKHTNENPQALRSQLLSLTPEECLETPESAIEEPVSLPKDNAPIINEPHHEEVQNVELVSQNEETTHTPAKRPYSAPTGNFSSKIRPTLKPPMPQQCITNQVVSNSNVMLTPESSSGFGVSEEPPVPVVAEQKPEAPPGCELIWPEDLPDLRASERRRKIMYEKEFLMIMRRLYAEREKTKILETSEDMIEEKAEAIAHEIADQATYNQLKQAVGNEAKSIQDEKHNDQEEGKAKTVLDVNKFTMAALCKDIPVGDRNDTFDDYELARVNRRRDTVRVFRAKMWSRRMYEPREEERSELKEAFKKYQDERKERNGKIRNEQKQKFTEIDATEDTSNEGHPQATIEIQANGDISLVGTQFDRHKNNRSQRDGSVGPRTEVDPTEQVINSYSFSTRERPDRWTKDETAKFYEAVSALGTDFNLISHLFPMRSRNQIKTKFKYEEKRNPAKLQMYLVSKRKFNVDSYSQVSNVPIEEVGSIESELEKVRREHAEQMKMEEASRMKAKEEDQKKVIKRGAPETAIRSHTKRERLE